MDKFHAIALAIALGEGCVFETDLIFYQKRGSAA